MRCVAFVVLLLSLEVLGQTSVSDGGRTRMVGGIAPTAATRTPTRRLIQTGRCVRNS